MNILIIGSGGREHTLAWKIRQSPLCNQLYIAPGNAGTANCGTNLNITVSDFENIRDAIVNNQISLVIVGPEDPLVKGITDFLAAG
ncbi:MAG: phosphoribosylamine--glycine ligase N-terminal domain-containing protein [Ferruginibacter sp.]